MMPFIDILRTKKEFVFYSIKHKDKLYRYCIFITKWLFISYKGVVLV
ncbi:Uncharacterised protein [Yersinia similis]|nr:Uncharacterised protein [Yersinia similis]CNB63411.1 Uncharacterised protein [Yersinia similis]CNF69557.1 Uncharacterised protein [Yersinia similis]